MKNTVGKVFDNWKVLEEEHCAIYKRKCLIYHLDCGEMRYISKYILTKGKVPPCLFCKEKSEDISGRKFGKFTVLGVGPKLNGNKHWRCQCECGKILSVEKSALLSGKRYRCRGCTYDDLLNKRFFNRVVIKRDHLRKKWLVKCDCGEEKWVTSQTIKKSKGCGRCESKKYIGRKFGDISILSIEKYENYQAFAKAICICGTEKIYPLYSIITGQISSCGCKRQKRLYESAKNLIGIKIGLLTIKKIHGYEPGTQRIIFLCKCRCGKTKILKRSRLDGTHSCGCLKFSKPKGEMSPKALLKNSDAYSIREIAKSKLYSQKEIAKMYNVNESVISAIILNKTYC